MAMWRETGAHGDLVVTWAETPRSAQDRGRVRSAVGVASRRGLRRLQRRRALRVDIKRLERVAARHSPRHPPRRCLLLAPAHSRLTCRIAKTRRLIARTARRRPAPSPLSRRPSECAGRRVLLSFRHDLPPFPPAAATDLSGGVHAATTRRARRRRRSRTARQGFQSRRGPPPRPRDEVGLPAVGNAGRRRGRRPARCRADESRRHVGGERRRSRPCPRDDAPAQSVAASSADRLEASAGEVGGARSADPGQDDRALARRRRSRANAGRNRSRSRQIAMRGSMKRREH